MSTFNAEERPTILVELAPRPGLEQVSRKGLVNLADLSTKALDSAMSTVRGMAKRVSEMVDDLAGNPDEVEVEFGIKLDFEGQALIAKAGTEAAIGVTLTWKREGASGE